MYSTYISLSLYIYIYIYICDSCISFVCWSRLRKARACKLLRICISTLVFIFVNSNLYFEFVFRRARVDYERHEFANCCEFVFRR